MVQFSNGFTWYEVYAMPLYLRRFYFKKLVDLKKKEAEENKKAQSKMKSPALHAEKSAVRHSLCANRRHSTAKKSQS